MTTCARGCCWNPYGCAQARTCACHWDDRRPATVKGGADAVHKDPTAQQAIANVMRERKPK